MSGIAAFFCGKTILVTGATGFLGQPLVEKILYVAPAVEKIVVLIRPRKRFGGRVVTAADRLRKELYGSSVFDRLRSIHGQDFDAFLEKKLVAVPGDISEEGLGLAREDAEILRQTVDVVVNSAAVVSFDAPLDQALEMNVLAARRVTEFAASCEKAVFVQVSTAYVSGADRKIAPETLFHSAPPGTTDPFPRGQFSDTSKDLEKIRAIVDEVLDEADSEEKERDFTRILAGRARRKPGRGRRKEKLEEIRRTWIQETLIARGMKWARSRGWNDTYTYTKALGEQMVMATRREMPTVILRPSVIESSLSEPCPGWLDGLRMADPLIAAIGKGRLKSLPLNPDVPLDLVPVDTVVNALVASIPGVAAEGGVRVYQVATASRNPITLGELYDLIYQYFRANPMLDKSGKPILIRRLRFPHPKAYRIQHRLKSVPLDTAEKTLERLAAIGATHKVKRRISATRIAHEKLYYYGEIYEPYLNLDCKFEVRNTLSLYASLSEEERRLFNFDVDQLNWRHYIQNVHIPGVKKFILKMEGAGTMELDAEVDRQPFSTIGELIDHVAEKFSERTALQSRSSGKWVRYSYRQVRDEAEAGAILLGRLGLSKGDRVLLYAENSPEWGITYLAAARRGIVVVPVDPQAWKREVWEIARFTDARAILLTSRTVDRLGEDGLRTNEKAERPIFLLSVERPCHPLGRPDLPRSCTPDLLREEPPPVSVDSADDASIIFTSGTAVDPRGAVLTHESFLKNVLGVHQYLPVNRDDALLSVLPLNHALEFTCGFLMPLFGGACVTYTSATRPRLLFELMRETGTTCLLGVPALFSLFREDIEKRVLKSGISVLKSNLVATGKQISRSVESSTGRNIGKAIFAKVHEELGGKIRLLVSGGSSLGEELYAYYKNLGIPIHEGYGLTETAPVVTVSPLNRSRPGSAGKPLPGVEVRLEHPDREGIGEIVVNSPSLMRGYFRNPGSTRVVMEDGWLRTGDLGWVDLDGYIYVTGRIKDVIVTGAGKNVYPADLEAIYGEVEGVAEIGVVGVKSGLTEEVHALVRPNGQIQSEGEESAQQSVESALRSLGKELATYQRLQGVHFSAEPLPRKKNGQVDREEILRMVRERLGMSGGSGRRATAKALTRDEALLQELSRLSGVPRDRIRKNSDIYADLGLDSLLAIELLLFLEHKFGVTIPDEQASGLSKVGDFLEELQRAVPVPSRRRVVAAVPSELPYVERSWGDRTMLALSHFLLAVIYRIYCPLKVRGAENVPVAEPYILAPNHTSHADTGAVITALRFGCGEEEARRLHVLGARDYFFGSPVKSWLVSRLLNVVPIERRETSLSSLRLIKRILQTKDPVLIFPEGTRTRTGKLQEFKPGVSLMAVETQVPIVPVLIEGASRAMPIGAYFPKPARVTVSFGKPIAAENCYRESAGEDIYRRIASDVRAAVQDMASRGGNAE